MGVGKALEDWKGPTDKGVARRRGRGGQLSRCCNNGGPQLAKHGPSDFVLDTHGLSPTPLKQAGCQASHRSWGCPIDWPVKGHLVGWLLRDGPRGQGWD